MLLLLTNISNLLEEQHYQNIINGLNYGHELVPLATAIFLIGLSGFIESREFLSLLVNTEIMMLGINFHLITTATV